MYIIYLIRYSNLNMFYLLIIQTFSLSCLRELYLKYNLENQKSLEIYILFSMLIELMVLLKAKLHVV